MPQCENPNCKQIVSNRYLSKGKWVCWDCALKYKLGQFKDPIKMIEGSEK